MNEIKIINKIPIILTKDTEWIEYMLKRNRYNILDNGGFILLPQDAIVVLREDK